jgi:hypothetical protein
MSLGDEFVSIVPFEDYARLVLEDYSQEPRFFWTTRSICKTVNGRYRPKPKALSEFAQQLEASGQFSDVKVEHKPSAIGLPLVVSYVHRESSFCTEFDGVLFVSKKQLASGDLAFGAAHAQVLAKGANVDDTVQFPNFRNSGFELLEKIQPTSCVWSYVAESAGLDARSFRDGVAVDQVILELTLNDPRYFRLYSPTMHEETGKEYSLLIGQLEHIRQVSAHQVEVIRYLRYMENKLGELRSIATKARNTATTPAPLLGISLFQSLNLKAWHAATKHWTSMHRSLEQLVNTRGVMNCFDPFLDGYRELAEKGIGHYNLQNAIVAVGHDPDKMEWADQNALGQYETYLPVPAEFVNGALNVRRYDKSKCLYCGLPEGLMKTVTSAKSLARDTYDLLRELASTSQLQYSVVVGRVNLLVLFLAVLTLVVSAVAAFLARR